MKVPEAFIKAVMIQVREEHPHISDEAAALMTKIRVEKVVKAFELDKPFKVMQKPLFDMTDNHDEYLHRSRAAHHAFKSIYINYGKGVYFGITT